MPDCENFNVASTDPVDNTVVAFPNLVHFCVQVLRNRATAKGLLLEAVSTINQSCNPAFRVLWLILCDVVLDLLEPEQRPCRPDNLHALSISSRFQTSAVLYTRPASISAKPASISWRICKAYSSVSQVASSDRMSISWCAGCVISAAVLFYASSVARALAYQLPRGRPRFQLINHA